MKIVIAVGGLKPYEEEYRKAAGGRAELVFVNGSELTEEMLRDADGLIGNPPVGLLKSAERLRWLQTISAGVENYTEAPDFSERILLTNVTGAFGDAIAEYILGGLLALCRRLFLYKEQQKNGIWKDVGAEISLSGKKALILGAGDIGRQTAVRLGAFGVHVTGVRRVARDCPAEFERMITLQELDEYLPEADIIVGCLPQTPQTIRLLDENRFAKMKHGVLLVNVGRGTMIDTEALVRALDCGQVQGAVLDVTDPEPLPTEHELWKKEQVLITPHISGRSFGHNKGVEQAIVQITSDNMKRFLDGRPLRNTVDFQSGYADYRMRGKD